MVLKRWMAKWKPRLRSRTRGWSNTRRCVWEGGGGRGREERWVEMDPSSPWLLNEEGVTRSRVVGVLRNGLHGGLKGGVEAVDDKVEAAVKEQGERLEQYQKVCGGGAGAWH